MDYTHIQTNVDVIRSKHFKFFSRIFGALLGVTSSEFRSLKSLASENQSPCMGTYGVDSVTLSSAVFIKYRLISNGETNRHDHSTVYRASIASCGRRLIGSHRLSIFCRGRSSVSPNHRKGLKWLIGRENIVSPSSGR